MNLFGESKVLAMDDIGMGRRGRYEYGDIDSLAQSIKTYGQIHPIAVKQSSIQDKAIYGNFDYLLIAGGRRFKAMQKLGTHKISARIYESDLDEGQLRAIELFENMDRKALTPPEEVRMTKEFHELMVKLNGEKISRTPGAEGHSMRDTAKLLGKSVASVSKDIKLANQLEVMKDIDLGPITSKATAKNILARLNNALDNAITLEEAPPSEGKVKQLSDSYILGDTTKEIIKLPSNKYSLIEVDPPYAVNINKAKRVTGGAQSPYMEVGASDYADFILQLTKECYRVAKEDAWIIWWLGPQHHELVYNALLDVGFLGNHIPAIWTKPTGQTNQPYYDLASCYELFLYMHKGAAKVKKLGRNNIFSFNPVVPNMKRHITQRPKELMMAILDTFAWPGTEVLVPFLGSGVTLEAAYELDMDGMGFDLSSEHRDAFVAHLIREETND